MVCLSLFMKQYDAANLYFSKSLGNTPHGMGISAGRTPVVTALRILDSYISATCWVICLVKQQNLLHYYYEKNENLWYLS